MTSENTISRRGLFMKLGILFNGLVATALTGPIVRFLLSSVTQGRASAYLSWVPLGHVSEFPPGETRLATFRNPYVTPTDGRTVHTGWLPSRASCPPPAKRMLCSERQRHGLDRTNRAMV